MPAITQANDYTPQAGSTKLRALGFSTVATLGANGVFTGAALDALNYKRIQGRAMSDVASAALGLVFQFSDDAVTWDTANLLADGVTGFDPRLAVTAGGTTAFDLPIPTRYVRIVYTNGAGAQTTFRLSAYLA